MGTQRESLQYEGLAAIEKALSDPQYCLRRRSTVLVTGGRITLEEAFRLAQEGREALLYAASN